MKVLTEDSEVLARIQDGFLSLLRARSKDEASMIDITCFYEELPTKRLGLIVPKHSAILPGYAAIAIHRNHAEMTKFSDVNEPGFEAISGELKRWIRRIQQTPSKAQKQPVTYCKLKLLVSWQTADLLQALSPIHVTQTLWDALRFLNCSKVNLAVSMRYHRTNRIEGLPSMAWEESGMLVNDYSPLRLLT